MWPREQRLGPSYTRCVYREREVTACWCAHPLAELKEPARLPFSQNVLQKVQLGVSPNTVTTGIPPIFKRPPPVKRQ